MASGGNLRGAAAMLAKIQRVKKLFPDHVATALRQEMEIEATEVRRRTPVDTGELRGSVQVVGPARQGSRLYVMIVAGGTAAPYAIYVHEDLEAFHKVGQAKFLESVILESRPYMLQRLARRIQLNQLNL